MDKMYDWIDKSTHAPKLVRASTSLLPPVFAAESTVTTGGHSCVCPTYVQARSSEGKREGKKAETRDDIKKKSRER